MTTGELIEHLQKLPPDAEATYLHNINGFMHIEEIECRECKTLGGRTYNMVILKGAKGDDEE